MEYRSFGSTGLSVSERAFGGWAIGGASYGRVEPRDALEALARAEDLGCNFVDTAAVYGASEELLGRFLEGRRHRWLVASKYSQQPEGLTEVVEQQLRRMRTDHLDFYQLHWVPRGDQERVYDELERLRQQGKLRFTGASLYSAADIDYVLDHTSLDGFQVRFSLLDPDPFIRRLRRISERRPAVIVRSVLASGFLTGKYAEASTFADVADQRHGWDRHRIRQLARRADSYRFLLQEVGSMHAAAIAYALSFPEVSTVVLSTKNAGQAVANFGPAVPARLSPAMLLDIERTQRAIGVFPRGAFGRLCRRVGDVLRSRLRPRP